MEPIADVCCDAATLFHDQIRLQARHPGLVSIWNPLQGPKRLAVLSFHLLNPETPESSVVNGLFEMRSEAFVS